MKSGEIETLRLFVQRLRRLKRTRLAQLMREPGLTVQIWEQPNGDIEPVLPEIDEDYLDAFLMNWRLFMQKNERISVRRVSDLILRSDLPSGLRDRFLEARDALNVRLGSAPVVPMTGGSTNREFLDTMLYGFFAHLEPAKHEFASRWEQQLGKRELSLLFTTILEEVMKCLEALSSPVEHIVRYLRSGDERPNQMPEPTSGSVTPRADARVAPPPPVAHR